MTGRNRRLQPGSRMNLTLLAGRRLAMNSVQDKTGPIQIRVVAIALSIAFGSVGASCLTNRSAKDQKVSGAIHSPRRMPDGRQWTTDNLNVNTAPSYCYEDAELNCRRYGRLYTWESAQRACQSLGDGWRLPSLKASRRKRSSAYDARSGASRRRAISSRGRCLRTTSSAFSPTTRAGSAGALGRSSTGGA
jgi:hypothetical protein